MSRTPLPGGQRGPPDTTTAIRSKLCRLCGIPSLVFSREAISNEHDGLQNARARVRELNRVAPRDYFIYSEHHGVIEREEHAAVA